MTTLASEDPAASRIDVNYHFGVPGWVSDGRHVRLSEIDSPVTRRQHLAAMILLRLALVSLQDQWDEVTNPTRERVWYNDRRRQRDSDR